MTDEELLDRLQNDQEFNPWLEVADAWLGMKSGYKYFLAGDECKIKDYGKSLWVKANISPSNISQYQFVLDILPQPFIGSPCAPIWVLLKNPGYSSADVYDLRSIRSGKRLLLREGVSKGQILTIQNYTNEEALKKRRELVCDQLRFRFDDKDKSFYVLRNEFKTIGDRAKGNKTLGGYNWYKKYFCCETSYATSGNDDLRDLSRNVFVLEYVPYHSKQYFDSGVRFRHQELWKELICNAMGNKILIMRRYIYTHIMNLIETDSILNERFVKAERERKIVILKDRKARLVPNNTYWPCSTSLDVNPLLRITTSK